MLALCRANSHYLRNFYDNESKYEYINETCYLNNELSSNLEDNLSKMNEDNKKSFSSYFTFAKKYLSEVGFSELYQKVRKILFM